MTGHQYRIKEKKFNLQRLETCLRQIVYYSDHSSLRCQAAEYILGEFWSLLNRQIVES